MPIRGYHFTERRTVALSIESGGGWNASTWNETQLKLRIELLEFYLYFYFRLERLHAKIERFVHGIQIHNEYLA